MQKYKNSVFDDALKCLGWGKKRKKKKLTGGLMGLYVNLYTNLWAKKEKRKSLVWESPLGPL